MRPFIIVLMVVVAAAMVYGLAVAVGWTDNPFNNHMARTASVERTTTEKVVPGHKPQRVQIQNRKQASTLTTANCLPKARQARLSGLEAPKAKRTLVLPDYPERSMRRHEEGRVELSLCIDQAGRVQEAKVAESSGFAALDESARDTAIRDWRFEPAEHKGQKVALWMPVGVRFTCKSADGQDICSDY